MLLDGAWAGDDSGLIFGLDYPFFCLNLGQASHAVDFDNGKEQSANARYMTDFLK